MLLKTENEGKSGARFAWDMAPMLSRFHIYITMWLFSSVYCPPEQPL